MFNVRLLNPEKFKDLMSIFDDFPTNAYQLSQFAAATCYQPTHEKVIKSAPHIDVENSLYRTRHHTTIQHGNHYLTFEIENIPVSLVTFGLHLTHPFYNSSQRSGRYCTTMFDLGDEVMTDYIDSFINSNCHDVCDTILGKEMVVNWVRDGINFYKNNINKMCELAEAAIRHERPHYTGNVKLQAERIAQEQLRCVLSTIFTTRLVHTINVSSLLSMKAIAWNTPLRELLRMMCDTLPDGKFKEFAKELDTLDYNEYVPRYKTDYGTNTGLCCAPDVEVDPKCIYSGVNSKLIELYNGKFNNTLLDTFFFNPNTNTIDPDNSTIKSYVEIPVSAFGQDQRHRTIRRSNPTVTGNFFVPPLVDQLPDGKSFCADYIAEYIELTKSTSTGDMIHFIPYGAMVSYTKEADVRAYLHSANKRLCFNAESTISAMEKMTVQQLSGVLKTDTIDAPCATGKCPEGKRYCGRDLAHRTDRELI